MAKKTKGNTLDIRSLSLEELKNKIQETENNLETMKLSHKISPIENPIQLRKVRREVARLKTLLTEKLAETK